MHAWGSHVIQGSDRAASCGLAAADHEEYFLGFTTRRRAEHCEGSFYHSSRQRFRISTRGMAASRDPVLECAHPGVEQRQGASTSTVGDGHASSRPEGGHDVDGHVEYAAPVAPTQA